MFVYTHTHLWGLYAVSPQISRSFPTCRPALDPCLLLPKLPLPALATRRSLSGTALLGCRGRAPGRELGPFCGTRSEICELWTLLDWPLGSGLRLQTEFSASSDPPKDLAPCQPSCGKRDTGCKATPCSTTPIPQASLLIQPHSGLTLEWV